MIAVCNGGAAIIIVVLCNYECVVRRRRHIHYLTLCTEIDKRRQIAGAQREMALLKLDCAKRQKYRAISAQKRQELAKSIDTNCVDW